MEARVQYHYAASVMVEKNRLMLMVESISKSSTGVLADFASKAAMKVLHVDDDLNYLKVAEQCLKMQGRFRVDTVRSAEEAMEKMKKETYDAIISDYLMPGKNGLEFLKELREKGNDTPFIIFTGKGREEVAIKALNLGADGYFDKHGDAETVYCELAHGILLVVEKQKAKMKALSEEERLRAVLSSSPDAIMVSDLNGNIVDCNEAAVKLAGISSKESIIGKNSFEFISEKDRKRALENLKKTIEQGMTKNIVYSLLKIDGKEYQGELSASILKDSHGNPAGFVAVVRDITEHIMAEDTLRKNEEKLRVLLENLPQKIFFKDKNSVYISCNGNYARDLRISPDQIAGKTDCDFYPKQLAEKYRADDKRIMESGHIEDIEEEYIQDGQSVYVHTVKTPVRDENGKVVGILGIFWDITERKKAEQTLRVSLDRYRSFIEVTRELGWTTNANGEVVEDVPSFREFTGLTYAETKGWGWSKALHPDDLERTTRIWKEANATKSKYEAEYRLRRHDGVYRYFIARSVPVLNEDGSIREWVGACIDITERKKAEEKLKESEEKFKLIFEGARDGILAADAKTKKFVFANPRICEITGYSEKELLRLGVEDIHPKKDLSYVIDTYTKQLQRKIEIGRDIPVLRKDRNVIYCDINSYLLEVRERKFLVGLFRDVTERKNAEEHLKEMNKRLEATNEKLHVVGSLTRHDVRNKLSAVTGNAYLLRRKLAEDPKALEQLNDMEAAVRLVERIFEFAGTYEKLGVEQLISIDVGEAVDGAVSLFSDLKGVKIVNECGGLTVLADSLLSQLFYNLIDNSLKYGEKIRQIRVNYKTSDMDQLELVYEDDGVGIPDNMRSNLFKEGFTSGKGTGYGLFMIKRTCEVYGWNIQETGIQGKGVKFVITIPKTNPNGKENYRIV